MELKNRPKAALTVQVCIGSSCHMKGSCEIVELLQNAVQKSGYGGRLTLVGNFCIGKCDRIGVTVQVNDAIVTQVTKENFSEFWNTYIVKAMENETEG